MTRVAIVSERRLLVQPSQDLLDFMNSRGPYEATLVRGEDGHWTAIMCPKRGGAIMGVRGTKDLYASGYDGGDRVLEFRLTDDATVLDVRAAMRAVPERDVTVDEADGEVTVRLPEMSCSDWPDRIHTWDLHEVRRQIRARIAEARATGIDVRHVFEHVPAEARRRLGRRMWAYTLKTHGLL